MPLPIATPAAPTKPSSGPSSGGEQDATSSSGDFAALLALVAGVVPAPLPMESPAPPTAGPTTPSAETPSVPTGAVPAPAIPVPETITTGEAPPSPGGRLVTPLVADVVAPFVPVPLPNPGTPSLPLPSSAPLPDSPAPPPPQASPVPAQAASVPAQAEAVPVQAEAVPVQAPPVPVQASPAPATHRASGQKSVGDVHLGRENGTGDAVPPEVAPVPSDGAPAPAGVAADSIRARSDGVEHSDPDPDPLLGDRMTTTSELPKAADASPPAGPERPGAAKVDAAGPGGPGAATLLTPARVDAPAPTPTEAPTATPVAPPAVHDQIVSAVVPLHGRGDGRHEVTLELRPDDLGVIRVEVSVEHQTVHLTLHAVEPATGRLLSAALPELRSALADAGLTAGHVGVGPGGGGGAGERPSDDVPVRRPDGTELAGQGERNSPVRTVRTADPGRLDLFL